jgi:antitoxin component HigA of HigAB toxin-antitoxin module
MRYIIETQDNEGLIGIQISKWAKEKKLEVIEKAEPVVEIKAQLERVARALDTLQKSGYNSEVMKMWLSKKTGLGMNKIEPLLKSQMDFFRAIGVKI